MNNKVKELIEALILKTSHKQVLWNKGNSSDEFSVSLDNGGAVKVLDWYNVHEEIETVDLTIFNPKGEVIVQESIRKVNSPDYDFIINLHRLAKESYYRVDETIEGMISEIRSKFIIGNEDTTNRDELDF